MIAEAGACIRWALRRLGKAGGESSCCSVSVIDPSSSSDGGEIVGDGVSEVGEVPLVSTTDDPGVSQPRRNVVIVVQATRLGTACIISEVKQSQTTLDESAT